MDLYVIGSFLSFWTDPQNFVSVAKAAFGLGLVIFVHELGHFLVAKACGVKCEKFYVGFDVPIRLGPIKLPSALFKKQVGETEYGLGIIPLGGYVKMLGQEDNPSATAEENERIRIKKTNAAGEEEYELDPRSYPAKTVPQRMAIISAGVIMNLIFGVLFATVAYKFGVKYLPCVIGSTMPGDPAWTAGLQPGDKIVQLGKDGQQSEELRFARELRYKVVETGDGNLLPIRVKRADDATEWLDVTPNARYKKQTGGLPTIGVLSGNSNIVGMPDKDEFPNAVKSDLEDGDKIVRAVSSDDSREIASMLDLTKFMLSHASDEITLDVERRTEGQETTSQMDVILKPQPIRSLGVKMSMGPVTKVQDNSPAADAGLLVGDELVSIDGEEIGDPLLIDERLLGKIGQETSLLVSRNGDAIELTITPRPRSQFGWPRTLGGDVSAETLGIAFTVNDTIAALEENGAAETAGLQPGDQIVSFMFEAMDGVKFTDQEKQSLGLGVEQKFLPEIPSFATYFRSLQEHPGGLEVHVQYKRGEEVKSAILSPVDSANEFYYDRGIICKQLAAIRTATTWSEAFRLGIRETKEGIGQVFFTLRKIKDLYGSLGGPGTIAVMATSEASQGIPRLLIFLTLLSANLAVLNFLPIPILDGGHMLFLAYEGIFGKPVDERVAFGLTMLGLSFILALMVFVIGMDFMRFVG